MTLFQGGGRGAACLVGWLFVWLFVCLVVWLVVCLFVSLVGWFVWFVGVLFLCRWLLVVFVLMDVFLKENSSSF